MIIELRDVSLTVGSHEVLSNLQFGIQGAQQVVILGKSSSGKTSLANVLAGIQRPSSGSITIEMTRGQIGVVEQTPTFNEHLSAFDNVLLAAAARSLSKEHAMASTLEIFADLGLSHKRSTQVSHLSAWERTLVSIARAWVGDTTMLVIDQAFDGHDEVSVRTTIDTLHRVNTTNRSIIVTTSQPSLSLLFPDASVYELRDGRLMNISKLPSEVFTMVQGEQV